MPTPTKTYEDFIAALDSIVHNPSRRFLTESDLLNYARLSVLQTALRIGGLHFISTEVVTVADQRDYTTLDNSIRKIKQAHYVKNIGVTATEEATPLSVISQRDDDYIRAISNGAVSTENNPILTGQSADTPKFLIFWPETNTLRLQDPPSRTGDTLKLWCLGIPKAFGPTIVYDGDQMETSAVAYHMAKLARLKSRETQEAAVLDGLWKEACQDVIDMRSKSRSVRSVKDARFMRNRSRSINGAE